MKHQDEEPSQKREKEEISYLDYLPYYTFISDLLDKFDKPFVCLTGITNFNHGMFIMIGIVC